VELTGAGFGANFAASISLAAKAFTHSSKKENMRTATFRILVFAAVFFTGSKCIGQTVNYKILKDDPSDIANLQIRLHPFYAEGFRLNKASIGTAVELRYNLSNKMFFNLDRWGSWTTIAESPDTKKFALNELNAEYILVDKSTPADIDVVLRSSTTQSGNSTYTESKYITVPGTVRSVVAARGGVVQYKTPFEPYALKGFDNKTIKDTAGIVLSYYDVSGTSLSGVVVVAGVSFHRITNLHVLANGNAKRSNERWLSSYFDMMYAPVIKVKDFTGKNSDNNSSLFIMSGGDNGIIKKRLGWRYGMVADFHCEKRATFSGRIEIGSRPGVKNNGFYLRAGIGMTINLF
jgi:hypothetical protein